MRRSRRPGPERRDRVPLARGRLPALVAFAAGVLLLFAPPAGAQTLSDMVNRARDEADTLVAPAPWPAIAGEFVAGTALAAVAGIGVGLLAEQLCDDCDAGEPGGDGPGILVGAPVGATVGVWLIGRLAPPSGFLKDTFLGGLVGAAVFIGYQTILEDQSDALRWAGIVFPGALATVGWNRSRERAAPEVALRRTADGDLMARVTVVRVSW